MLFVSTLLKPRLRPAMATMSTTRLSLIPGDGIGPEIAAAVVRVFEAARVPVQWEQVNVSPVVSATGRTAIPDAALKTIKELKYGLKGPLATPVGRGHVSLNLTLRKALNLYANVRPCRSIAGYKTLYDNVDTVVIRENTEGEYSGIEHEVVKGVMQSVKLITRSASERISRYAFKYAEQSGRKHVTIVHKAAIMYVFYCAFTFVFRRASDGLFLEAAHKVAQEFSGVQYEDCSLDKVCLQVILIYLINFKYIYTYTY